MKRRTILAALGVIVLGVAAYVLFWRRGPSGPFPYAERVPANAAIYVAVPDLPALLAKLDAHPAWKETLGIAPLLARLEKARPHLSGPAGFFAVVKEGRLEWTSYLAVGGSTRVDGPEWSGKDSMAKVLAPFMKEPPAPRIVLNLDALPPSVREVWGDFSRAVLEIGIDRELTLRGTLTYRGSLMRILERRVHAPETPTSGDAAFSHSGLCDPQETWSLLDLPEVPEKTLRSLGPAWGVEIRDSGDVAIWIEAGPDAWLLDRRDLRDLHSEFRDGRLLIWTGSPPRVGPPERHTVTRWEPRAAAILRRRLGRGDPVLGWLERVRIESRGVYRGRGLEVDAVVRRER